MPKQLQVSLQRPKKLTSRCAACFPCKLCCYSRAQWLWQYASVSCYCSDYFQSQSAVAGGCCGLMPCSWRLVSTDSESCRLQQRKNLCRKFEKVKKTAVRRWYDVIKTTTEVRNDACMLPHSLYHYPLPLFFSIYKATVNLVIH